MQVTMLLKNIITIGLATGLCAAITLLPPITGFVGFFVFAIVVRYYPRPSFPKRWLVYGALGGACVFFAAALFIAYQKREIPMAFYGLPPDKWVRIAVRYSFPIGGLIGSLVGYTTATLIRGAHPRSVMMGAALGFTGATGIYVAWLVWLVSSLRGQFVKIPSVVDVFCLVVLLLCLTIGGVFGTMMGALVSHLHRRRHNSQRPT
jgi:hypothetical protein